MRNIIHWTSVLVLLLVQLQLSANGIEVTNLQFTGEAQNTADLSFTVSWENSWRLDAGPANHDAAYVYAKFRANGNDWQHMYFTNFVSSSGNAEVESSDADSTGFFVYRNTTGSGNVNFDIDVQWDYGAVGVDGLSEVEVRVFAIEMVYVPEGAFKLGDGTITSGTFYQGEGEFPMPPYEPYTVSSEDRILVSISDLLYEDGTNYGDRGGPIPASFPKGFAAFYCMKYEVSQQQWVDFFNTLTPAQQTNLDVTGPDIKNSDGVVNRNGVSWDGTNPATTSLPDVAMNYIPNLFMLAYLDWAGLRPLTELEYEKACRGPLPPVSGEYAWGTVDIYSGSYSIADAGTPAESVNNPAVGTGNAVYGNTASINPLRVGIFAASAVNATRRETGGTYYGIMDMSGNLFERCVSVGNASNRSFSGLAGDGRLSESGGHNVSLWPSNGLSFRGGYYGSTASFLQVSHRGYGSYSSSISLPANGIRGGISAK